MRLARLVTAVGLDPVRLVRKMHPLLVFAFPSRRSVSAIPMNIQTQTQPQTQALGTPAGNANFSASFAALIVLLSAMNLPVALAGLLISIEPLIDMGRTALNVSGAVTAGTVTSRLLGQTNLTIFNNQAAINLDTDGVMA